MTKDITSHEMTFTTTQSLWLPATMPMPPTTTLGWHATTCKDKNERSSESDPSRGPPLVEETNEARARNIRLHFCDILNPSSNQLRTTARYERTSSTTLGSSSHIILLFLLFWTVFVLHVPDVTATTCAFSDVKNALKECSKECCGSETCVCNSTCTSATNSGLCTPEDLDITCKNAMCVTRAVEAATCTTDAGYYGGLYNSTAPTARSCLDLVDFYRCDWVSYGHARSCMANNTCWQKPSTGCNLKCYEHVMGCMIQYSCTGTDKTPFCYSFSVQQCYTAEAHRNFCDAALLNLATAAPTPAPAESSALNIFVVLGVVCGLIALAFGCGMLVMCRREGGLCGDPLPPEAAEPLPSLAGDDSMQHHDDDGEGNSVCGGTGPHDDTGDIEKPHRSDSHIRATARVHAQVVRGEWQRSKVVGRGATGNVYLCVLTDGSLIALKQLDVSALGEPEIGNHMRELLLVSTLVHPNVVRYYHAERDDLHGCLNIFMEFVQGGSLGQLVRRLDDPLREAVVCRYTRQILSALVYLHEKGIVHRDVKSDNVLLHDAGIIKLADFGSAKRLTPEEPTTTTIVGSPYWMAPEVIVPNPSYGLKADIWSLGITVCELLDVGRVPYPSYDSYWDAVWAIGRANVSPTLPAHASELAKDFISRCVERDVDKRASAVELLQHEWITMGGGATCETEALTTQSDSSLCESHQPHSPQPQQPDDDTITNNNDINNNNIHTSASQCAVEIRSPKLDQESVT
eukprot:PhM_4_TR11500/c0_g1_i1/m.97071/K17533/MAP3K19, YSK4; mitogen-activated protein kinase kinase kinase 19